MEVRSGIDFAWVLQHACRHEAPELGPESRQHGRGWPIVARAGRGWPILLALQTRRGWRRDRTGTVGPRDSWSPRDADHRVNSKRRAEGIVAAIRSASAAARRMRPRSWVMDAKRSRLSGGCDSTGGSRPSRGGLGRARRAHTVRRELRDLVHRQLRLVLGTSSVRARDEPLELPTREIQVPGVLDADPARRPLRVDRGQTIVGTTKQTCATPRCIAVFECPLALMRRRHFRRQRTRRRTVRRNLRRR